MIPESKGIGRRMKGKGWACILLCMALLLLSACSAAGTPESGRARDDVAAEKEMNEASGSGIKYAQAGMKFSILGDSISTFEGWVPEENLEFYPQNGAVQDVSQTWWKIVQEELELVLCANGSSSGSTCAGDSRAEDVWVGCSDLRISQLAGADGEEPELIIVYMGTNDVLQSIRIGDNDGTKEVPEGVTETFSDAYTLMLDKVKERYPGAQVYCCTLLPVGDWGTDQPFVMLHNGQELTSEVYADRIRMIAQNRGLPVIDLYHCGIDIDNMAEMTSDGVHLTPQGMRCVADQVSESMTRQPVTE